MDPRIALSYWLDDSDESYEAGRSYNESIKRGAYPAFVILEDGTTWMVMSVSGNTAKMVDRNAKKSHAKRANINRVSLY